MNCLLSLLYLMSLRTFATAVDQPRARCTIDEGTAVPLIVTNYRPLRLITGIHTWAMVDHVGGGRFVLKITHAEPVAPVIEDFYFDRPFTMKLPITELNAGCEIGDNLD